MSVVALVARIHFFKVNIISKDHAYSFVYTVHKMSANPTVDWKNT